MLVVRVGGDVEKAKLSRKGVIECRQVQSRRANKKMIRSGLATIKTLLDPFICPFFKAYLGCR